MVHLQADLNSVINWANANGVRWAFSDSNAGTYYANFYNNSADLGQVDWAAVASRNFQDPRIKEGKQAEFLMFDFFPWTLIQRIGTINNMIATQVQSALANLGGHQPVVTIEPSWYF